MDRVRYSIPELDPNSTDPLRIGVVWWHQRAGEFDPYLRLAYDAPLPRGTTAAELDLADIALPSEANLTCRRECRDRAVCDCVARPAVAWGSIVVAVDGNRDESLSIEELRSEQVGLVSAFIGWSATTDARTGLHSLAQFGPVESGVCAYDQEMMAPVTDDSTNFTLTTCPVGDATCELPVRRLYCFRDCERDWGLNRVGL